MVSESLRRESPMFLALLLVGAILGGLLVGYEPVGGDPDRMYRPLKSELARALEQGRLPFWSERFGLGLPLVAESHVAAFYPPNLALYRFLDVSTAYRLSMWLHYLGLAASTYFYARCLEITPSGAAISALAFTFCGFQAIHSSHEPFYCLMPYLPLALGFAERFMKGGHAAWLLGLPLILGLQWTLGHFQIQTWTGGLIILTALWRAAVDRRSWRRAAMLIVAVGWGMAMAAVQLGPSAQYAKLVGQTGRSVRELLYYPYPPSNWFDLVLPQLVRELRLGPEDPYWFGQDSTGYEVSLYNGTIPLILAFIAMTGRSTQRSTLPWRLIVPVSFALATMPRWWPQGYHLYVLTMPGIGYFRVPARYTLLTSLGIALLAGEGFDRSISRRAFGLGMAGALTFAGSAALFAAAWSLRDDVHLRPGILGISDAFPWAALAWLIALMVVTLWRSERLGGWGPITAIAVELGILYYAGTTQWGWSIAIPEDSPVLAELTHRNDVDLVGGELDDLPVRAGLTTGFPYTGFNLPEQNRILVGIEERLFRSGQKPATGSTGAENIRRLLRRFRVTHLVDYRQVAGAIGSEAGRWRDPALDQIVFHLANDPATRLWSIVRIDDPFPEARVATRARTVPDRKTMLQQFSHSDDRTVAWFLDEDRIPARPDGRRARLISWDGTNATATVDHDGPCDLILARTYDPGWLARIDDGPERPVIPVDGGFQCVRLDGSGVHRVRLRYRVPRWRLWASLSIIAIALDALAAAGILAITISRRRTTPSTPPIV